MRFGCCADINSLEAVERAGYDFVELPVSTLTPLDGEAMFNEVAKRVAASRVRPECWNIFVLPEVKLVGPAADESRIDAYLATVTRRVSRVGGQKIVFGSGAARSVPADWPAEKAHDQLVEFLNACADYADRYELIICIEGLRHAETNLINSYSEAVAYAREVNHPRIQVLADQFHLDEVEEDYAHVGEEGAWLAHAHVAEPGNRRPPLPGGKDYGDFFTTLKDVGYDDTLSVECVWDDFDKQAPQTLAYLKEQWEAAEG